MPREKVTIIGLGNNRYGIANGRKNHADLSLDGLLKALKGYRGDAYMVYAKAVPNGVITQATGVVRRRIIVSDPYTR